MLTVARRFLTVACCLVRCWAQGHTLEPLISGYFADSTETLCTWLHGLHSVVSCKALRLPEWTQVSFARVEHCVNDNSQGGLLLKLLAGLKTDAESKLVISPNTKARPDVAFALPGRVVVTVGCKMLEGQRCHSETVKDNMESTDLRQLGAAGEWRSVRICAAMAAGHGGGVVVSKDTREIKVVVNPPMLSRFLEGTSWADSAAQMLHMAGIPPCVQLLLDAGANISSGLLQLHGFGPARTKLWMDALPELRASYIALPAGAVTRDQVTSIIRRHVPKVEAALFGSPNVARWKFGNFEFTPA